MYMLRLLRPLLIYSLNWNSIDTHLKLLLILDWHNQHSVNSPLGVNKCLQTHRWVSVDSVDAIFCNAHELVNTWLTVNRQLIECWSSVNHNVDWCWLSIDVLSVCAADWGNKSTLNYRCLKTAFLSVLADEKLTTVFHNLNIPLKVCASLMSFSLTAPTLLDSTFSFIFFDL